MQLELSIYYSDNFDKFKSIIQSLNDNAKSIQNYEKL